jgi:tetratricopeptide (TPR) repeat protein
MDRVKALITDDIDCYIRARAAHRESSLLRQVGDKASSIETLERFIHSTVLPGHGREMDADARWNAYRGDLVVSYAENLIQTSELARARSELCEWEPIVPEFPSTIERLVLRTRDISLGRIFRFEGRFAEALVQFKAVLDGSQEDGLYKESSWYPIIISHVADMHCELGQPGAAIDVAEPALAQLTQRGWQDVSYGRRLHLAFIEALILCGSYTTAEEHLHSLIPVYESLIKPNVPDQTAHFRAWACLARISHMNQRWDEALARWQKAVTRLEQFRKGESFLAGVVWCSIAHCLAEMGKKDESEEVLGRVRPWVAKEREFWDLGFGTYWYEFVMSALGEEIREMKELKI